MRIFKYNKIKLTLNDNLLGIFKSYIQDTSKKNESGGILLGEIKDNEVYLLRATVPNKFDKYSRYNFIRDKEIAQIIADFEFINSNKKTIYFGEWHSHPEDIPSPSGQDIRMIKEQYKLGKSLPPYIFLIIQGRKDIYVGIYDGKNLEEMIE